MIARIENPTPSYRFVFRLSFRDEKRLTSRHWCLEVSFSPANIWDNILDTDQEH